MWTQQETSFWSENFYSGGRENSPEPHVKSNASPSLSPEEKKKSENSLLFLSYNAKMQQFSTRQKFQWRTLRLGLTPVGTPDYYQLHIMQKS